MEQAYQTYLQFLCHSLAKATSAAVRMYRERVCVYYYSAYHLKNTGICAATVCSRAAIAGGLDCRTAFRMSDLYIQKIKLLRDAASLAKSKE